MKICCVEQRLLVTLLKFGYSIFESKDFISLTNYDYVTIRYFVDQDGKVVHDHLKILLMQYERN